MKQLPKKFAFTLAFDVLLFTFIIAIFIYDLTQSSAQVSTVKIGSGLTPILFIGVFVLPDPGKKLLLSDVNAVYDVHICQQVPKLGTKVVAQEYRGPLSFTNSLIQNGAIKHQTVTLAEGERRTLYHTIPDLSECRNLTTTQQIMTNKYIVAYNERIPIPVDYNVSLNLRYRFSSYNSLIFATALVFAIMLTTMRFYTKISFITNRLLLVETQKRRNYLHNYEHCGTCEKEKIVGGGATSFEF